MGIIIGLVLVGLVWFGLRRTQALYGPALQLAGAALLLGLAGYALQGRASLAGSPASERVPDAVPPVMPIEMASEFYGRFNGAYPWLVIANGYARRGDSGGAVATIESAVRARPRDSELWIALGNALTAHSGGRLSPAAELAFRRSAALAPRHPGPPFFYGVALLQQGRPDDTLALWRQAASLGPESAGWQQNLRLRTALVEELSAVRR